MNFIKKNLKSIISLIITAFFIYGLYRYVMLNYDDFVALWDKPLNYYHIFGLWLFFTVTVIFNNEIIRLALAAHNVKMSFHESLCLVALSSAANYCLPLKAGSAIRAYYLKVKSQLTITNFVAQFLVTGVLTALMAAVFGFLGLIVIFFKTGVTNYFFLIYFVSAFIFCIALIYLPQRFNFLLKNKLFKSLLEGWASFSAVKGMIFKLCVLEFCFLSAWVVLNYFAFKSFGVNLNLEQLMFYTGGQIHVSILNITPGGLGALEFYGASMGKILSYDLPQGLSVQALIRLVSFASLVFYGSLGYIYLFGFKSPRTIE